MNSKLENTPAAQEPGEAVLSPGAAAQVLEQLTQSLYSISLLTAGWETMAQEGRLDTEQVADGFKRLGELSQQALKEIRLLIYQLQPPNLHVVGLVEGLQQRLDSVEHWGYQETRLLIEGEVLRLPRAVEEGLFQIAQEVLDNALRHARASALTVRIRAEGGQIILSVEDDGVGFDPSADSVRAWVAHLKDRAAVIGGQLSITSAPQEATTVKVSVPLKRENGG
jgi:signal transduction histidine kinase